MVFLWDPNNIRHLAKHGITPDLAERIFLAGLLNMEASKTPHRYLIEGTVDGKTYRLICDVSFSGSIYPITCFPL